MSRVIDDLKLGVDDNLREKLELLAPGFGTYRILRKSVDARRSRQPHYVYRVELYAPGEPIADPVAPLQTISASGEPPIIIGAGPAGLFAALRLVERGLRCRLFEQGSTAEKRMRGINRYWRYGELDPKNNVCFGEGGAGLYSDGKLITRIKSPHIAYVLDRLVRFGAPEEIRYLANPHVGSDRIRRVIPKMREYLLAQGCEIHFDTEVTRLMTDGRGHISGIETAQGDTYPSSQVILAIGHSATGMLHSLYEQGIAMQGKSFAMGLRIEHPQELINKIQWRELAQHAELGAANYKLTHHDPTTGIGVYSFCMCPGGYVLSSGTDADGVVCNGMSNFHRNSPFANAAIVVTVDHQKLFGEHIMAGMSFRQSLETGAKNQVILAGGTKELPAQRLIDFMEGRSGPILRSSSPSGVVPARLDQLLPQWMADHLRASFAYFNQHMRGMIDPSALLHGVESRTSCPVRMVRDTETLESVSHPGLYPTGEGAGYAGGITSAAVDGIRVAEAIVSRLSSQTLGPGSIHLKHQLAPT